MTDDQKEGLYPIEARLVRFFDWVPTDKRHLVAALIEKIAREEASIGADTQLCGCGKFIEAALRFGARATQIANSSEVIAAFHGDIASHCDECTPQIPESPDLFAMSTPVAAARG